MNNITNISESLESCSCGVEAVDLTIQRLSNPPLNGACSQRPLVAARSVCSDLRELPNHLDTKARFRPSGTYFSRCEPDTPLPRKPLSLLLCKLQAYLWSTRYFYRRLRQKSFATLFAFMFPCEATCLRGAGGQPGKHV